MLWRRVDCYGLHGTTRLSQNGLIARAATAANGSAAAVEQAQLDAVPLEYFRLKPRLDQQWARGRLTRNSLIEAALGVVAIAIVGALGTLPPPGTPHSDEHP